MDSSIHAPTNPSQGKNKNQLNNISPDIINTLLATVQQATTELQSITQRINNWEAAFASQQEELKQQSTRVAAIERILDISSPIAPITSSSLSSIVVSMPSSSVNTTRRTPSPITTYHTPSLSPLNDQNQALNSEMNDIKGNVNSLATQLASIQDTLTQALGLPPTSSTNTPQQ